MTDFRSFRIEDSFHGFFLSIFYIFNLIIYKKKIKI